MVSLYFAQNLVCFTVSFSQPQIHSSMLMSNVKNKMFIGIQSYTKILSTWLYIFLWKSDLNQSFCILSSSNPFSHKMYCEILEFLWHPGICSFELHNPLPCFCLPSKYFQIPLNMMLIPMKRHQWRLQGGQAPLPLCPYNFSVYKSNVQVCYMYHIFKLLAQFIKIKS